MVLGTPGRGRLRVDIRAVQPVLAREREARSSKEKEREMSGDRERERWIGRVDERFRMN